MEELPRRLARSGSRIVSTRLQWVGTFEPEFSRNRRLRRLLHLAGVQVETIRRDVWGSDRLNVARQGKLAAALKAMRAYVMLVPDLLRAERPDIYLVSYPGWFDLPLVWAIGRIRRVPILFDPFISLFDTYIIDRGLARPGSILARLLWVIDRVAIRLADGLLADTGAHLDLFRTIAGKPVVGHVLPLGADDDIFVPQARHDEDGLVVFHGTFVPLQGATTIVEAAADLDGVARIVMIGDGQDRRAVEERIAALTIKNVELVGLVSPAEVVDWIARCRVALGIFGTSKKADRVIPHKVYECLAVGVPVITRASSAVDAMFSPDEIVTVPAGDPQSLAQAIRDLLGNQARRQALGTAGHRAYRNRYHESVLAVELVRAVRATARAAR